MGDASFINRAVALCALIVTLLSILTLPDAFAQEDHMSVICFATYAANDEELQHALVLARSIRQYGGRYAASPIRVFVRNEAENYAGAIVAGLRSMDVELVHVQLPDNAPKLPYFTKLYAAAQCEAATTGNETILVWMDEDTILLQEPAEALLPDSVTLGFRPVMHRNVGSDFASPLDSFWQRIYQLLKVDDSAIYPMRTVAEQEVIRPYINAGLLVVRPERRILRTWLRDAEILARDSLILSMVREDQRKAIFLHQTALVGPLLRDLSSAEVLELSNRYNYPLFFDRMFGAAAPFDAIDSAVTLRYDTYFQNPEPGWEKSIKGNAEKVEWIAKQMSGTTDR